MSALPELVFVTYYRVTPVGQMGVFKRCTRLIERLAGDYDIHLVNFGPLPERDAQFAAIRDSITVHAAEGNADALLRLFGALRPQAVVFGEAPLRGAMRLAHRIASHLGLHQIAIENTYDRRFAWTITSEYPGIDQWLLMGPLENGFPERLSEKVLAVPPFIRYPEHFGTLARDRVTVVGYDLASLALGIHLLQFLEPGEAVDFFVTPEGRAMLEGIERPNMRVLELPDDATIFDSMARAKYVVGKSGYGQITEALMLGAPMVARLRGGGIGDETLPHFLKPHVRILRGEDELRGVPELPPPARFAGVASLIPDAVDFAARALRSLIDGTPLQLPGTNEIYDHPTRPELRGVYEWKDRFEARHWDTLRAGTIWLFDRAFTFDDFVAILEDLFSAAADIKLLLLDTRKVESVNDVVHVTASAVMLWGERDTWKEHELEFDLHLGWGVDDGAVRFEYFGTTQPIVSG
ncbi:MAG TPA: hypothetical protein VF266_20700 [Thermoanaerobaculia bacterium]